MKKMNLVGASVVLAAVAFLGGCASDTGASAESTGAQKTGCCSDKSAEAKAKTGCCSDKAAEAKVGATCTDAKASCTGGEAKAGATCPMTKSN